MPWDGGGLCPRRGVSGIGRDWCGGHQRRPAPSPRWARGKGKRRKDTKQPDKADALRVRVYRCEPRSRWPRGRRRKKVHKGAGNSARGAGCQWQKADGAGEHGKQAASTRDGPVSRGTHNRQPKREREDKKKTKPATFAAHKGARGKRGATDATPTPAQTRLHRCGRRGPVLSRTQWILTRGPRRGAAPQHAPPAGGAWAAAGGRRGPRPIGLKQLIDDVIRARPPPAVAGTRARARRGQHRGTRRGGGAPQRRREGPHVPKKHGSATRLCP